MIPLAIRFEINTRLAALEAEEGCRVLFAIESGSRAWGFPSTDSDYDVRFIYARPAEWYLSVDLEDKRDVIERPINDLIDLAGWDVRKALQLFAKTNPPLYEWLEFAHRLCGRRRLRERLARADAGVLFAHRGGVSLPPHGRADGQGLHAGRVGQTEKVLLRPAAIARRALDRTRPRPRADALRIAPPTIEGQTDLLADIRDLLVRKVAGEELDEGPRSPSSTTFNAANSNACDPPPRRWPPVRGDRELLNDLFRKTVQSIQ